MKRALYEWTAIASFCLSLACIVPWFVSLMTPEPSFVHTLGRNAWQIFADKGKVTCCDNIGNLQVIDLIVKGQAFTPEPSDVYRLRLPGFEFNQITFPDDWRMWSVTFTPLIPFFTFALLGVFCFSRYRAVQLAATTRVSAASNDA